VGNQNEITVCNEGDRTVKIGFMGTQEKREGRKGREGKKE